MTERGIIMSGDNPKLILDDRKNQTRRVIPQKYLDRYVTEEMILHCPYGVAGDRLWVREKHWHWGRWLKNGKTKTGRQKWKFKGDRGLENIRYATDYNDSLPLIKSEFGWWKRPSIFMPKWAARTWLEILKVHVERLQDITYQDCIAEGIRVPVSQDGKLLINISSEFGPTDYLSQSNLELLRAKKQIGIGPWLVAHYAGLWDSLHGKGSWNKNPYVWVLEFKNVLDRSKNDITTKTQ